MTTDLRLRPLRDSDESDFRAAHRELAADDFEFGLGLDGLAWPDYLRLLESQRAGIGLPVDRVPATFLVGDVDGTLVGRISIRHELNDFLAREGGHIGYGVRPAHRRRGYATEMLRQGMVVARSLGVDRVLITCDDDNLGSSTVIESCGGKLETVATSDTGRRYRRYWID